MEIEGAVVTKPQIIRRNKEKLVLQLFITKFYLFVDFCCVFESATFGRNAKERKNDLR
jgi:hypothetical protein